MKKPGLIFLLFLLAFLTACGGPQHKALQQNRTLWESQPIQHYRFNLKIGCNCPWGSMMPLAIEVQAGEILSMTARNNEDITRYLQSFTPYGTIESLFDTVDSAISKGVYKLDVTYDETYGFPASILINPSRLVMDDEKGYYVTNVEFLP